MFGGYLGQRLFSMVNNNKSETESTTSDKIILKSWIQNRLREYFVIQEARRNRSKDNDYSPILKPDNFDVMSHELKVFDVELSAYPDGYPDEDEFDRFMDILMGTNPKFRPPRSEHDAYRTGKVRLTVTYQESIYSAKTTIHLLAHVGQIDDLSLIDNVPTFALVSEKLTIDVYTRLFPMLEDWARTLGVKITLPVAKCYFGKYEEGRKVSLAKAALVADNNILSKVAAGLEIEKETPVYESHRLLLLEDIHQDYFEMKNAEYSLFLPLFNVQAALAEMAVIHCSSWAFTKITNNLLTKVWPFISNDHYLPHLKTRVEENFPTLMAQVENYLEKKASPDKDHLLSCMKSLEGELSTALATTIIPSSGPLCVIHQGLNFSTVLFRHSLLPPRRDEQTSLKTFDSEAGDVKPKTKSTTVQKQSENSIPPTKTRSNHSLINREVCIVDWQNASFGSPMIDVAFFLLTSLPPLTRKSETPALLKFYWDQFEAIAKQFKLTLPWTAEEIFNAYVHGLLYGCLQLVASTFDDATQDQDRLEVFVEAVRDLIQLKAF